MEIGGWQHFIYFSFYHFNPQKCNEMVVNFMGNPKHYDETPAYRKSDGRKNFIIQFACSNHYMRTGNGTAMLTILPLRHQRNFTLSDY